MRVLVFVPEGGKPMRVMRCDSGQDLINALAYLAPLCEDASAALSDLFRGRFETIAHYGLIPRWEDDVAMWAAKYLPGGHSLELAEVLAHNG